MKRINLFFMTASLAGVLLISAAFSNCEQETTVKPLKASASNKGFAVVELFTSEGCSSCPPADALVEKIQQDNFNSQIYILAYHVDYWNHQGWKDRFSDREYSNRQRQYASWLNI